MERRPVYIELLSPYTEYDYEVYSKLLELEKFSNFFYLTDDPAFSDLIIIIINRAVKNLDLLYKNPTLKKFSNKSFLYSLSDFPPQKRFRGIYASASSIYLFKRSVSTSYTTLPKKFQNEYFQKDFTLPEKRNYLFSFIGRNSHRVRTRIFKQNFFTKNIYIEDSSDQINIFNQIANSKTKKKYFEILMNSKFSLCPRGQGPNSIRLFESMRLGIAPIIISDSWDLPNGPNWKEFSIRIREQDIPKIEDRVKDFEPDYEKMGKLAKENYFNFFDDSVYFDNVLKSCIVQLKKQLIPESFYFNTLKFYK